jgi:thiamine biosynthesis lipoprotein ApbE
MSPINESLLPARMDHFELTPYGQALEDLEVALVKANPDYMDLGSVVREFLIDSLVWCREEVITSLMVAGEEIKSQGAMTV